MNSSVEERLTVKFAARFVFVLALATLVADQAVAQSRPKVETNVDQRDKLLAELEVKNKAEVEEAKKTKAVIDEKLKKLEARERTQRKALRSTSSARRRQSIAERLAQISKEREGLNDEMNDSHADIILDNVEQERRQIIKKFPRPGDPKYVELEVTPDTFSPGDFRSYWFGRTRLLDEKEAAAAGRQVAAEKDHQEKMSGSRQVADAYLQSLIERGILRSAQCTGGGQVQDTVDPFGRARTVTLYQYRVEYVSKAGLLNVRDCSVQLYFKNGSWAVDPTASFSPVMLRGLP